MSRRKQSKPRQIKRSLGDLDSGEDNTLDNLSLSGEEGGVSDPDDSVEGDSSSPPPYTPLYNEVNLGMVWATKVPPIGPFVAWGKKATFEGTFKTG